MDTRLFRHRSRWLALGLATAVLAAWWTLPGHDGDTDDYGPGRHQVQGQSADPAGAVERPVRRVRATSTMPYFSFARSLRPRS